MTRIVGYVEDEIVHPTPHMPRPVDMDEIHASILRDQPCDEDGMWWEDVHARVAWTPRGFAIRGDRFFVRCRACSHKTEAPYQKLIDAGKGDWIWARFNGMWTCACGSKDVAVEVDAKPLTRAGLSDAEDD